MNWNKLSRIKFWPVVVSNEAIALMYQAPGPVEELLNAERAAILDALKQWAIDEGHSTGGAEEIARCVQQKLS